jgi:hypothetical protein
MTAVQTETLAPSPDHHHHQQQHLYFVAHLLSWKPKEDVGFIKKKPHPFHLQMNHDVMVKPNY